MTLKEMKRKTLGLIEELNPKSVYLTDDPDIAAKFNDVANQVMFELARLKRIPKYIEIDATEGSVISFEDIERECGYEVYQLGTVCGVNHILKAEGTVIKILESGRAEIDFFVYPERITDKTKDNYEIELSSDLLEIMPYGIAADLLKSDVSSDYGNVYASRYEAMKGMLDPRYRTTSIIFEGGVKI